MKKKKKKNRTTKSITRQSPSGRAYQCKSLLQNALVLEGLLKQKDYDRNNA
jgi:hypothetical protein